MLGSDSEGETGAEGINDSGGESPGRRSIPRKSHGRGHTNGHGHGHGLGLGSYRKTFKDIIAGHRHNSAPGQSPQSILIDSQKGSSHNVGATRSSPEKTKNPSALRGVTGGSQFRLNRTITLPSSTPSTNTVPKSQQQHSFQRRRARANSLHFPSEAPASSIDDANKNNKDFYLSHYSTDRAYSLEPTKKQINLELGLGDDFDHSFGEAMRKGLGAEEMPLSQQALRVLSEAKENMDIRLVGKQGRKGSLGMGLFKESRDGSVDAGKKRVKVREQVQQSQKLVVPEEAEEAIVTSDSDALSPILSPGVSENLRQKTRSDTTTLPPTLPVPTAESTSRPTRTAPIIIADAVNERDIQSLSEVVAGIQLISSPSRDATSTSPQKSTGHRSDVFSEESEWTTTDSDDGGSTSDGSDTGTKGSQDPTDSDDDEGESMTVPLQPFNHAVGGHSSIYKFTRRAVCKVSPFPSSDIVFMLITSRWSAARICFMKRWNA
jgi:hypothetical protein